MNEPRCRNRRTILKTIAGTTVGGSIVSGTGSGARAGTDDEADSYRNKLTIVADHDHGTNEHRFELDTREVSAGWTTITFDNRTDFTHFAYLAQMPRTAVTAAEAEGAELLEYYFEHVTRPFQWFMDDLDPEREPDPDDLSDTYSDPADEVIFPPWFEDVLPSGGPGLTSPETTSMATVNLEPGEYIVECYVKDDEGRFHSYLGMLSLLTVTGDRSGVEPEPTLDLSISTDGIDVRNDVRPRQHTIAVRIEDQHVYEHLLGHDVHLIRLEGGVTTADVNDWMNWMDPDGLVSDGTEPGTFLGGVQTILTPGLLAEGDGGPETAYVHAELTPGDYAFVSEVPDPSAHGLLTEFSVPSG